MNNEVSEFLKEFREVIDKHLKFFYYTRGIEFQKSSFIEFKNLMKKLGELKGKMIRIEDEESANTMLGLENLLEAYINELKMLIFLKEDRIDEAWQSLVKAQMSLRSSCQASDIVLSFDAENYVQKLFLIEKLFFPPQVFQSIGIIVESSKCSICNQEYGACDHVKGRPYMGKLCYRIITKVKKIKDVSVVDVPSNKLCRVTSFLDKGHWRDTMTWRILKKPKKTLPEI